MKTHKIFTITALVILFVGCGNDSEAKKDFFSLDCKNEKKAYTNADALSVLVNNKKDVSIDSVTYFIGSERVSSSEEIKETSLTLANRKLGTHKVVAKIYSDDETFEASKDVIILSSIKPHLYTYKILESYPHDIKSYTQGLEFENDTLYESAGLYKQSALRKLNYQTGEILKEVKLADQYFAEGLTIMNDKLYQLTYQENTGFIYDLKDLKRTGTFVYGKSKEGWGLCNDGEVIYKSDGTEKIWTLDPNTLAEDGHIEIYTNTSKIPKVNELEWVEGKIYANIYQKDAIAIVDPTNGAVEGVIDLGDLKDNVTQHKSLDVLNGIAYNGEPNILYITGKNWDKLFKVEIIRK